MTTPTKMTPGDELHLTLLMAPQGLNFVTGQDRQHLLAYGRAAFDAGKAAAEEVHLRELAAYRTTVENLKAELVQEAARTAEEKLRADQMSQQHDTQADLNRDARELLAALKAATGQQPFGYVNTNTGQYFKDVDQCRKGNEGHWRTVYAAPPGSVRPQAQDVQRDADIQRAVLAERERICAAIKAEDDHCVTQGDYMLDSEDCIKVVRGEWVRPVYEIGSAASAAQGERDAAAR